LDGWRAIAISLVLWHHATMSVYGNEPAYWSGSASQLGSFGVDIFFALSGLLITTLLLREAQAGELSLRNFYIRRVFRIFPPLLVFLAAAVLLQRIRPGWELLSSVLLFRNYLPESFAGHTSAHLWSLSIEEHFYLLWPALLAFVAMRKGPRLVAYLAIAAALWRIADVENGFTAGLLGGLQPHFRTDQRLDALLWGCFAAFLLHDPRTSAWLQERFGKAWFAGCFAAALACVIVYSYLAGLWLAMLLPMLLVLTLLHPEWLISRLLDLTPVRFVGRISYSLYLWQQLFLIPGWMPTSIAAFPLNLGLTFATAALSYYFVERPCIAYGRKLTDRLRGRVKRLDGVLASNAPVWGGR
jgi:peptidoglycan/LPS O-acetylase OafA/YrhL